MQENLSQQPRQPKGNKLLKGLNIALFLAALGATAPQQCQNINKHWNREGSTPTDVWAPIRWIYPPARNVNEVMDNICLPEGERFVLDPIEHARILGIVQLKINETKAKLATMGIEETTGFPLEIPEGNTFFCSMRNFEGNAGAMPVHSRGVNYLGLSYTDSEKYFKPEDTPDAIAHETAHLPQSYILYGNGHWRTEASANQIANYRYGYPYLTAELWWEALERLMKEHTNLPENTMFAQVYNPPSAEADYDEDFLRTLFANTDIDEKEREFAIEILMDSSGHAIIAKTVQLIETSKHPEKWKKLLNIDKKRFKAITKHSGYKSVKSRCKQEDDADLLLNIQDIANKVGLSVLAIMILLNFALVTKKRKKISGGR
jgi:hypothetical protein